MKRNDMLKAEREALEFKELLSKQREKDTTMSVGPALSDKNITAEEKRIVKEMNKGIK